MNLKSQALKVLLSMMLTAKANLEGQSGKKMEDWVADQLLTAVESSDNLIPMLKTFVDEPWADKLEAAVVKQGAAKGRELVLFAIRKAYAYAVANGVIKPEEEPTKEKLDAGVLKALGLTEEEVAGMHVGPNDIAARKEPEPLFEAGQDMYGNKQDQHGNLLETNIEEPTPTVEEPTPTTPQPVQPNSQTGSPVLDPAAQDDKKLDAYLQEHFSRGGGWYEFESKDTSVSPHRVQGRDAAKAYLQSTPEFADAYNASKTN